MLRYITGVPSTGKTYICVYELWQLLNPDDNIGTYKSKFKDKKYDFIYTNINGLKFDISDRLRKLNFDDLEEHIKYLHETYKANKSADDIDALLIEECKQLEIYNCHFYIDECHQFFDMPKSHLIWWLTYHRHLYHDLTLITQNLSLVNAKYKTVGEFFIKAVPSHFKLNQNYLKYVQYTGSQMYKKQHIENSDISIKIDQKIYSLYTSGKADKYKSHIMKYFIKAGILFIVLMLLIYFIMNYMFSNNSAPVDEITDASPSEPLMSTQKKSPTDKSINQDFDFIHIFKCYENSCSFQSITYPKRLIFEYFKGENFYITKNASLEIVYFLTSKPFKFNIKEENEKNPINSTSILPSF